MCDAKIICLITLGQCEDLKAQVRQSTEAHSVCRLQKDFTLSPKTVI